MVGIIDIGLGNIGSIKNMLKKISIDSEFVTDPKKLLLYKNIILPGVGAFDTGMKKLKITGFKDEITECVIKNKQKILGICLGMQLLTNGSEEGCLPGLGLIDAEVKRFSFNANKNDLKIPHMGWCKVKVSDEKIFSGLDEYRYYFVHSYYVKLQNRSDEIAMVKYGLNFTAGFNKDNVTGVQFHPEKSHRYGMIFFKNYLEKI